jgi:hypothetical protein
MKMTNNVIFLPSLVRFSPVILEKKIDCFKTNVQDPQNDDNSTPGPFS